MTTTRLAALAASALLLAGCATASPASPSALPTPSRVVVDVSESGSPSPTPSATVAAAEPCPSRTTEMSLDQANRVAANPTTGETWLSEPKPVDLAAIQIALGDEGDWFEVGERDGHTIYAGYGPGMTIIEETPDGSLTWISRPFPGAEEDEGWTHEGLGENSAQCYESLALPTVVSLPDGTPSYTHRTTDTYVYQADNKGVSSVDAPVKTLVGPVGGTDLYRLSTPSLPADVRGWDLNQGVGLPDFEGVTYALKLPFGGWLALNFEPLQDAAKQVGVEYAVDFFDASCGTPGYQALVPEGPDSDWTVVGTSGGRDIAIPTATNPYAIERYAAYVALVDMGSSLHETAVSFEAYLATPGLIALRADEGGWWVGLNQDVSPRRWC